MFERLPSVILVWHDLKLQHGSSNIVGLQIKCGMPTEIPPSRLVSTFSPNSFVIETNLKRICYPWVTDLRCTFSDLTAIFAGFILPL